MEGFLTLKLVFINKIKGFVNLRGVFVNNNLKIIIEGLWYNLKIIIEGLWWVIGEPFAQLRFSPELFQS